MGLRDLVGILQIAIGPVILISGIGLLVLSMTNRLGRLIDRSRQLTLHIRSREHSKEEQQRLLGELHILARRARIARAAIGLALFSVLLASCMIISIFLAALFELQFLPVISILFIGCMISLISSLALFLHDINLSLEALKLEIGTLLDPPRP